jgi:hypothetical protein
MARFRGRPKGGQHGNQASDVWSTHSYFSSASAKQPAFIKGKPNGGPANRPTEFPITRVRIYQTFLQPPNRSS